MKNPLPPFYLSLLILSLLVLPLTSAANDTLVTLKSNHSVADTADRFENLIAEKGLTFFTRIDHSANAEKAELTLRPTQVILFGNPKAGTPLMNCAQTVAIDLPQKALFWEDENSDVWLGYNDPAYLKERHSIAGCNHVIEKITGLLSGLATAAVAE